MFSIIANALTIMAIGMFAAMLTIIAIAPIMFSATITREEEKHGL